MESPTIGAHTSSGDHCLEGILKSLDVIYQLDEDPCGKFAVGIVASCEHGLLAFAERVGYYNVEKLRETHRATFPRYCHLPQLTGGNTRSVAGAH